MKVKRKQSGVTLIEMIVVVAIVAMLAVLATPAIRSFLGSMATEGSTKAMIGSALSSARAIAIKEHRYAGIRFQKIYDPNNPVKSPQYAIFIIHDSSTTANGFVAVKKIKPIKFPVDLGVASGNLATIDTDSTRVSIVFSPSGKLVIHPVRTNRSSTQDDIFNDAGGGLFDEDGKNYDSERSFVIYDIKLWQQAQAGGTQSDFINKLKSEVINVNPYTGRLISTD